MHAASATWTQPMEKIDKGIHCSISTVAQKISIKHSLCAPTQSLEVQSVLK